MQPQVVIRIKFLFSHTNLASTIFCPLLALPHTLSLLPTPLWPPITFTAPLFFWPLVAFQPPNPFKPPTSLWPLTPFQPFPCPARSPPMPCIAYPSLALFLPTPTLPCQPIPDPALPFPAFPSLSLPCLPPALPCFANPSLIYPSLAPCGRTWNPWLYHSAYNQ